MAPWLDVRVYYSAASLCFLILGLLFGECGGFIVFTMHYFIFVLVLKFP